MSSSKTEGAGSGWPIAEYMSFLYMEAARLVCSSKNGREGLKSAAFGSSAGDEVLTLILMLFFAPILSLTIQ